MSCQAELTIQVDKYTLPAGLLRHFDLTSTPTTSRRENYPGGLLFIDRLLALAEINGKLSSIQEYLVGRADIRPITLPPDLACWI